MYAQMDIWDQLIRSTLSKSQPDNDSDGNNNSRHNNNNSNKSHHQPINNNDGDCGATSMHSHCKSSLNSLHVDGFRLDTNHFGLLVCL